MATERLSLVLLFRLAVETASLGLSPVDDRGPHMGLQGELDVDHAEVVCVAAGAASLSLALRQPPMLLGLQNDLSRPCL